GWPISPDALKWAVRDVARAMTSPERKMVKVWRARRWLGDPAYRALPPRSRRRADPRERLLPKHDLWPELLFCADAEEVARRFGMLAYLAGATKPVGAPPLELVADVPFEEVAVLMLIQDLAPAFTAEPTQPRGRRRAASSDAPADAASASRSSG
ncbi:MAG: hypothetical protein M3Q10_19585, partial [Chloroflexota bacterium]|nr:hypothetical protein [Chloroflexota bacterium]